MTYYRIKSVMGKTVQIADTTDRIEAINYKQSQRSRGWKVTVYKRVNKKWVKEDM